MLNLVIVSSDEKYTFQMILVTALKFPKNVNWKILGDTKFHTKLVSIFGIEKFLPISSDLIVDGLISNTEYLASLNEKHVFIPTDYFTLKYLLKLRTVLKKHEVIPLMDQDSIDFLDDKFNQFKICKESGVHSPEEYTYEQLAHLPTDQKVVIKPHLGSGSQGVFVFENTKAAITYYQSLDAAVQKQQVIQQYISSQDYYYYATCLNGEIYFSGLIQPIRKMPVQNVSLDTSIFDAETKKLVQHYNYTGPISIDYRIDASTKKIYVIEINPRNGANCYLFSAMNVNWFLELVQLSQKNSFDFNFNKNRKLTLISKFKKSFNLALFYLFFRSKAYRIPFLTKLLF